MSVLSDKVHHESIDSWTEGFHDIIGKAIGIVAIVMMDAEGR
jgi:hypothetical protein